MEMRALHDTTMAQDVIPPVPPIAAALHCGFLRSHCSSCFRPLGPSPLSCGACSPAVCYCSPACFTACSLAHAASGECILLQDHCGNPVDADVRAALRLLHSFETRGLLSTLGRPGSPRRIGGLFADGLEEVLAEDGELAVKIREGAALMSRARYRNQSPDQGIAGSPQAEVVLWAVFLNAVEVQLSETGSLGVAVYGSGFSWFNHSCKPNACYRFELAPLLPKPSSSELAAFHVSPAQNGVLEDGAWISGENGLPDRFSMNGPRVVVRSIRPIKKGDEVCVTYVDLLQPKVLRHSDLWEKYRFICCCERCSSSPQIYIDHVMTCDARNLNLRTDSRDNEKDLEELTNILDKAIEEYTLHGNPKACCDILEDLLSESSQGGQLQAGINRETKFQLHPLHYISLNAYITLSSAYNVWIYTLVTTPLDEYFNMGAFKACRAAIAYSWLLAGSTYHLFLSEPSLLASTAHFLIAAADSTLSILKSSKCWPDDQKWLSASGVVSSYLQRCMMEGLPSTWVDFEATSMKLFTCIANALSLCWSFLTSGFSYLEKITSPLKFDWPGSETLYTKYCMDQKENLDFPRQDFIHFENYEEMIMEDEIRHLFQLAAIGFVCGIYLANICYGPDCYLVANVRRTLNGS